MGGCVSMSDIEIKRALPRSRFAKKRSVSTSHVGLGSLAGAYQKIVQLKLCSVLPKQLWKGRRCFIIGGGPSLRGFDYSALQGEIVITVNRGFEAYLHSAVNVAQDARLWGWYEEGQLGQEAKRKFSEYLGYKAWLNVQAFPFPEDIHTIDICHASDFNFEDYSGGIPPYGNSGLNALCLAVCLGANPIYLLGFDCKGENGKTANYHSGYPDSNSDSVYKSFAQEFNEAAHLIKSKTSVINLHSDSGLRCFEFGSFQDIKKIERPLYISYFTKGTGYELEVERLGESLRKFGLEYRFIGIKDLGSWRSNIHARIKVLRDALDIYGRDIVYIDADGAMVHYPELFDNFQEDFGAVWLDREKYFPDIWKQPFYGEPPAGKWEILGGTMYFKNNERTRALLDTWEELDAPMKTALSQVHLIKAIDSVPELKVKRLPDGYCQIYDIMASAGEPMIEHYQASRRGLLFENVVSREKDPWKIYQKETTL